MGRPSGLPKTGGRKKGTPNRKSLYAGERLEALGVDPLAELSLLLRSGELEPSERSRVLMRLLDFVHPRLKQTELPRDNGFDEPEITYVATWADRSL